MSIHEEYLFIRFTYVLCLDYVKLTFQNPFFTYIIFSIASVILGINPSPSITNIILDFVDLLSLTVFLCISYDNFMNYRHILTSKSFMQVSSLVSICNFKILLFNATISNIKTSKHLSNLSLKMFNVKNFTTCLFKLGFQ